MIIELFLLQVPFLILHLCHMPKHTALAIVGCVSVFCNIASSIVGDELTFIIHDLSLVQTMYMVHRMTDEDAQAALVLKHTVGLCVVLDNGLKIGQLASLLYAIYLSMILQDAIVYHLVFLGFFGLFTALDLTFLSEVCKFCLFISVYDMARLVHEEKEEKVADAA